MGDLLFDPTELVAPSALARVPDRAEEYWVPVSEASVRALSQEHRGFGKAHMVAAYRGLDPVARLLHVSRKWLQQTDRYYAHNNGGMQKRLLALMPDLRPYLQKIRDEENTCAARRTTEARGAGLRAQPPGRALRRATRRAAAAVPAMRVGAAAAEGGRVKLVGVYDDTRGTSRCGSCDEPIVWYQVVKSGKRMPFDSVPVYSKTEHEPSTMRLIGYIDTDTHTTHFATCEQAAQWRRPSRRREQEE